MLKDISNEIKQIMKIKDFFTVDGITYIVEDYYDGNLEDYLEKIRFNNHHISPNLIKKYLCN